ncbi:unnamed protein product [Trichobilharzia regenti]|nr:unnamed protein product [Trichobilharzia regenti]
MSINGTKHGLNNKKPMLLSSPSQPSLTAETLTKFTKDYFPVNTDMFVMLYYDSRSLSHSLPTTYRHSLMESKIVASKRMTVETRNEWYNLVAESDKFVVEGNEACQENISPAHRYTVNFSKLHYDDFSLSSTSTSDFEYRDTGACFYRNSILSCGDQHQNWFGIIPGDGAVAISLVKTSVYFYSHLGKPRLQFNHLSHKSTDNLSSAVAGDRNLSSPPDSPVTNGHEANLNYLPAWLVIVRREKGSDLRGCVINKTHIQNDKSLYPLIFQELNTDAFSNNNNNQDDDKSLTLAMTNSLISETTLTPNVATMSAVKTTGAIGNTQLNSKVKKPTKKLSIKMKSAPAGNIPEEYSLLQYLVKNENIMEYLKPGVRDRSVYEKLLKLDEMEVSQL